MVQAHGTCVTLGISAEEDDLNEVLLSMHNMLGSDIKIIAF